MRSLASEINLRDLEVFLVAARAHSLREAARQLDLLPAHTSKIIKSLEEALGVQLFRRSVSGVILTPEGIAALGVAEKIRNLAGELRFQDSQQTESQERIWTFGSIGFLATYLLSSVVCDVARTLEVKARFRLIEFTHNDLVAHGLKGAFEYALHIGELEWTRAWASYPVGALCWKLYARYQHPLPERCQEAAVAEYPFVVPTDWGTNGYAIGDDFCPLPFPQRRKGNEASTAQTALEICRHSDQLTFIPEILAIDSCRAKQIKAIEVDGWSQQEKSIYLSVKTDVVCQSMMNSFLQALRKMLSK